MKNNLNPTLAILSAGFLCIFIACGRINSKNKVEQNQSTSIFPKGDKLNNGNFTGDTYLWPLLQRDKNNDYMMGHVSFEPGARTNWHTHPKGQVLIVTDGSGFYQERGNKARPIKKGDIVNIPENTEHWHGASASTKLTHIAITNYLGDTNVTWLKPVSDEEFALVSKN